MKTNHKLTQEEMDALSDACNPKSYLIEGALGDFDIQARTRKVWKKIAKRLDVDELSLEAVPGKGVSEVKALPLKNG